MPDVIPIGDMQCKIVQCDNCAAEGGVFPNQIPPDCKNYMIQFGVFRWDCASSQWDNPNQGWDDNTPCP